MSSRLPGIFAVVLVLALLVVSSSLLVGATARTGTQGLTAPRAAAHVQAQILPVAPATSGRGTFFTTHGIPLAPQGNRSCWAPYYGSRACNNGSADPSINYTSKGLVAVAYTAITNISECGNATANASVEIGFSTSTNLGATWSAPKFLGNPQCSQARNYPNSDQPSLTSLANGTLVLAYIEYSNVTSTTFPYYGSAPPDLFAWELRYDRLVVRESYDNGSTWTTPTVVNSSFDPNAGGFPFTASLNFGAPPSRPWVTATGDTVYLTWENTTDAIGFGSGSNYYSSGVYFAASTTGGASWGATSLLTATPGSLFGTVTHFGASPYVLTAPNGTLFIAFQTNVSYDFAYCSPYVRNLCTGTFVHDLELATSTNNGTTFAYSPIATTIPDPQVFGRPFGAFTDPSPAVAFDPMRHTLVAAWSGGLVGDYCFGPTACFTDIMGDIFAAASTPNGTTFSPARLVDPGLLDPNGGVTSGAYLPAIAVDAQGVVHLTALVNNWTMCYATPLGYGGCEVNEEVYYNSTNGGATFSTGLNVWAGVTPNANEYLGEYTTIAAAAGHLWLAWSAGVCPPWNASFGGYCQYGYNGLGYSQVAISQPFTGAGLTIDFHAVGLPATVNWTASLMGNVRGMTGNGTVSVSGVPAATPLFWNVPWVNTTYHTAEASTVTPAPVGEFTTSPSTINVVFSLAYGLELQTNPVYSSIAFTCSNCGVNYGINPSAGLHWDVAGTSVSLSAYPHTMYCFGYCFYDNLSFVTWVGTGRGSVTTTAATTSATLNGPINETAVFNDLGYCLQNSPAVPVACVPWSYNVTFLESGLPRGTAWSVTANNTTLTTTTGSISSPAAAGLTYFTVWDVPTATPGMVWVPTTNFPSPVGGAIQGTVDVTYTLQSATGVGFAATVNTTSLPNATAWSAAVNGQWRGTNQTSLLFNVTGGSAFPLNTTPIELENGTGYYVASITAAPFELNQTATTVSSSSLTWTPNGPVQFTLHYRPMYRLTTASTSGGSASPSSEWVDLGASVGLAATAATGFSFVGWSGTGPGATTLAQDPLANVAITPRGPVSEFATFRLTPAQTWNVTVVTQGLDAGTSGSLSLNGTTYSGNGTFHVGQLSTGLYPIAVPFVASANSPATRFVPSPFGSTFSTAAPGTVLIDRSGTIWLNYTAQYAVTVTAQPGGSVAPVVGVTWFSSGTTASYTAAPQPGFKFSAWNGTGPGGVSGTSALLTWTVLGPAWETASFVAYHPAPATYSLVMNESGLPAGTTWSVAVGPTGASGAARTMTVAGLNGTYPVSVPTVYLSDRARFVPSTPGPVDVSVDHNASFNVSYSEEFLVSVVAGAGGSVTPAGGWTAANGSLSLSATPSAGYSFVNWTGTGAGAYSGTSASTSVTVTGPLTESANFASASSTSTTGVSSSGPSTIAIVLIVGLAGAGLVAGWAVGRMRRGGPGASAAPEAPADEGTDAIAAPSDWAEEPAPDSYPPAG